jgi:hypothetical protein
MASIKERVMKALEEDRKKEQQEANVVKPTPKIELNQLALSTYQDSTTKKWMLVKIKYDPVTNTVGEIERKQAEDKASVIEMFKLAAVENDIV